MLMRAVVERRPVLMGRPALVLRGRGAVLVRVLCAARRERVGLHGLRRLVVNDPLTQRPDHRLHVRADGQEQQQESEPGPHRAIGRIYEYVCLPETPGARAARPLPRTAGDGHTRAVQLDCEGNV